MPRATSWARCRPGLRGCRTQLPSLPDYRTSYKARVSRFTLSADEHLDLPSEVPSRRLSATSRHRPETFSGTDQKGAAREYVNRSKTWDSAPTSNHTGVRARIRSGGLTRARLGTGRVGR